MGRFTDIPLVHNFLWPVLMGALGAVAQAIVALANGGQVLTLHTVEAAAAAALIAYASNLLTRYAGQGEPWGQPQKLPTQAAVIVTAAPPAIPPVDSRPPSPPSGP
jgi:hypothetical protein